MARTKRPKNENRHRHPHRHPPHNRALRHPNNPCGARFAGSTAGAAHESDNHAIICDWFRAQPKEVWARWEAGNLKLFTHYDEGGGFAKINAAGAIADVWAEQKPEAALRWYVEALLADKSSTALERNQAFGLRLSTSVITQAAHEAPLAAETIWRNQCKGKIHADHWLHGVFYVWLGIGWPVGEDAEAVQLAKRLRGKSAEAFLKGRNLARSP